MEMEFYGVAQTYANFSQRTSRDVSRKRAADTLDGSIWLGSFPELTRGECNAM
jgi:hypothetical protein